MRLYFSVLRFLRIRFLLPLFLFIVCLVVLSKFFMSVGTDTELKYNFEKFSPHKMMLNSRIAAYKKLYHPSLPLEQIKKRRKFVPGHFLKGVMPKETNYCRFKFDVDTLNWTENVTYSPELGTEGPYRVLYNVIEVNHESKNMTQYEVTYCTHATVEFLYHIVEIARRWNGLISIAVFVPGSDAFLSLTILRHICHCFPEMAKISMHFVFPTIHPASFTLLTTNDTVQPENSLFKDCSAPEALLNGNLKTYIREKDLFYPVNVARNVARVGAKSSYILVSDVELLPSRNMVHEFIAMLGRFQHRHNVLHPLFSTQEPRFKKYVFVLPVFEVESDETDVPQTKGELLNLYTKSRAVYFHRWVCLHCQRFPGLHRWLQKTKDNSTTIKPLLVVRREFPYHRWEPIYIGTNHEPFYNELLSWEGQQDKMTQMNELCLLGYRFVILDNAFLVHMPGMKRRSDLTANQTLWRKPHQRRNIRIYKTIAEEMALKYKGNKKCRVCFRILHGNNRMFLTR